MPLFAAAIEAVIRLDLNDLEDIIEPVTEAFQTVGEDAAKQALLVVQVEPSDGLIAEANKQVLEFAESRAAELVGKKIVDGKLIDNPDAKWSINEATRNMLRESIAESFQEGLGVKGLKSAIENSYAFSPERAEMIARTETLAAFNAAALAGYKASGVNMKKKWLTAPGACDEICIPNEEQGAILLDELFSSGDAYPPGHPNAVFEGFTFYPYGELKQLLRARFDGPAITLKAQIFNQSKERSPSDLGDFHNLSQGNIGEKQLFHKVNLLNRNNSGMTIPIEPSIIEFTIGPNHPMLSRRGWIRANEIVEGDELLYDERFKYDGSIPVTDFKKVHLIENVFSTLSRIFTIRTSFSYSQFHGDEIFTYGKIETIFPTRNLLEVVKAEGIEKFCKCSLMGAYPDAIHVSECRSCQQALHSIFLTRSSNICSAKIISCHNTHFKGWAYDASTSDEIYNSGGFIVKNCRCTLIPIVIREEENENE